MVLFSKFLNVSVYAQAKYNKSIGLMLNFEKSSASGGFLTFFFNDATTKSKYGINLNYYKFSNGFNNSHFKSSLNYNYKIIHTKKILSIDAVASLSYVEFKYHRNNLVPKREKGVSVTIGPRLEVPSNTRFSLGAECGIGPYFYYTYNEFKLKRNGAIYQEVRLPPFYQTGFFAYYNLYLQFKFNKNEND
ncbi:MAG TPA: hypothetical protein PKN75_10870 [Bacteroidia bacterium]|nr:hypothetical protein [Bacteroidia bacterium]HNU34081.1 hypothetical protein [Bacteroidia bacterium]